MSLGFSISTYAQEFRPPAQIRPTRPRPTSAHRRNKPHPKPDFLLPRVLPHRDFQQSPLAAHTRTSALPPVPHRGLAFAAGHKDSTSCTRVRFVPAGTWEPHMEQEEVLTDRESTLGHRDATSLPRAQLLRPCTGRVHRLFGDICSRYEGSAVVSAEQKGVWRPFCRPLPEHRGCSCFQLIRPSRAGHYIIHPEFTSESMSC